ncbi:rRNA methyltransferase [Pradoshia sp.]
MWKNVDGRLIQATDITRVKFRTNISKTILDRLAAMAEEHDTYINYLLETGLENVLNKGEIIYNKETRPKDRIQYKTTYDKDLLERVKEFAKQHNLFINDVIEYSVSYIDVEKTKDRDYKYRIER